MSFREPRLNPVKVSESRFHSADDLYLLALRGDSNSDGSQSP